METIVISLRVVIIAKTTLAEYAGMYPLAAGPISDWYNIVKGQDWKNFADVKKSFNSVDAVGNDRYCFNIKGNDFRLIVLIIFKARTVFILWFGSHAEYNIMNKRIGAANVKHEQ